MREESGKVSQSQIMQACWEFGLYPESKGKCLKIFSRSALTFHSGPCEGRGFGKRKKFESKEAPKRSICSGFTVLT